MTRRNRFALAFAFLIIPAALAQEPLWFLQMSDPQFGMYTENKGFSQETANFEFAIATANRLKPKFVVVTGDLTNKAGDADQIAEFHRIAHKLAAGIDLRAVAGNHDVGNTPTAESLAAYRKNYGPDYYTFAYPGFEGIVLNSSLIQHPEGAPEEAAKQEKWLEAELAKAKASGVQRLVVFQHIPFFIKSADEPDDYFNIPLATRKHYIEMFEKSGVRYIFAGHLHHSAEAEVGGLHMISAGPVGMPLGEGASGMRVVKMEGSEVTQKYFDFGHLPNTLEKAFGK